jgi:hypothetical protein
LTDPALVRVWPRKWLTDPEIGPAIRYLDRFLHDFQQTTETTLVNTINRDGYDSTIGMVFGQPGFRDELEHDRYNDSTLLSQQSFENTQHSGYTESSMSVKSLVCKTISNEIYTATDNMVINATNRSTLILPSSPCENCTIIFTKDTTQLTLQGNGRKVNDRLGDWTFHKDRLARQIFYFIEEDAWYMI